MGLNSLFGPSVDPLHGPDTNMCQLPQLLLEYGSLIMNCKDEM